MSQTGKKLCVVDGSKSLESFVKSKLKDERSKSRKVEEWHKGVEGGVRVSAFRSPPINIITDTSSVTLDDNHDP